jgi:hypothetical protein
MFVTTSAVQWSTAYAFVGTLSMIVALILLVGRPVAGRTQRVAKAAAELVVQNAQAAAKLTVEASEAANQLAISKAVAAAKLELDTAVRNTTLDDRLSRLLESQEGTTRQVITLLQVQEAHDRRLIVLETHRIEGTPVEKYHP